MTYTQEQFLEMVKLIRTIGVAIGGRCCDDLERHFLFKGSDLAFDRRETLSGILFETLAFIKGLTMNEVIPPRRISADFDSLWDCLLTAEKIWASREGGSMELLYRFSSDSDQFKLLTRAYYNGSPESFDLTSDGLISWATENGLQVSNSDQGFQILASTYRASKLFKLDRIDLHNVRKLAVATLSGHFVDGYLGIKDILPALLK